MRKSLIISAIFFLFGEAYAQNGELQEVISAVDSLSVPVPVDNVDSVPVPKKGKVVATTLKDGTVYVGEMQKLQEEKEQNLKTSYEQNIIDI